MRVSAAAKTSTARQSPAVRPLRRGRVTRVSSTPAMTKRRAVVPSTPSEGSSVAAKAPPTCTLSTATTTSATGPYCVAPRGRSGRIGVGVLMPPRAGPGLPARRRCG